MADFLLDVGLNPDSSVTNLASEIESIASKLKSIKIDITIDKGQLSQLENVKTQLQEISKIAGSGLNGVNIFGNMSGVKEVAKNAEAATKSFQTMLSTSAKAGNSGGTGTKTTEKSLTQQANLLRQINSLTSQVRANTQKWTAAQNGKSASAYSGLINQLKTLQDLYSRLSGSGDVDIAELNKDFALAKQRITGYTSTIKQNGEATQTLGQRVTALVTKFSSWFSVSQAVMAGVRAVKDMVNNVIELDTAMTDLKKVTDETDTTYAKFLTNAETRAKNVGATLTDTVSATADFARLGYDIDEASELADIASIYKNVGDFDSIDDASESIISTMQAFGVLPEEAMSIVDKFNEVGNNFAISSEGIGDALLNSASAMAAANNTLDETIALAAAANTVVQDPNKVGTSLKTVSMYLRAAETDAEAAGIETDGMASSVSELRQELLALTGNKVDIQIDDDNFKSTYQIIKELSEVWDSLTDISQANILELIGGKRNSNVISAMLENFDVAEEALASSLNSTGSAVAENEKYLDSVEGKIQQFKSSLEALSNTAIGSDFLKSVIDAGRELLDLLNEITSVTGGGSLLTGVLGGLFMQKQGWGYSQEYNVHWSCRAPISPTAMANQP